MTTAIGPIVVRPATAHGGQHPPSAGCAQVADTGLGGGWYFASSQVTVRAGTHCRYTSTSVGGFQVTPVGSWSITVERPDGSRAVYAAARGSAPCADDAIAPGDLVDIASPVAGAAGPGIGCGRGVEP